VCAILAPTEPSIPPEGRDLNMLRRGDSGVVAAVESCGQGGELWWLAVVKRTLTAGLLAFAAALGQIHGGRRWWRRCRHSAYDTQWIHPSAKRALYRIRIDIPHNMQYNQYITFRFNTHNTAFPKTISKRI
jgi:hypothetical protein